MGNDKQRGNQSRKKSGYYERQYQRTAANKARRAAKRARRKLRPKKVKLSPTAVVKEI